MEGVAAIVMAAGKGTRMKSKLPKVLHQVCGKPLVSHVIQAIRDVGIDDIIVVVGHEGAKVEEALGNEVRYAYQNEQLGTGHAVLQAKGIVDTRKNILVVSGDTPLLSAKTLADLLNRHQDGKVEVTVLTAVLDDPIGYGRVIRDNSNLVVGIIEEKDASAQERLINEINTGTYCFDGNFLFDALQNLQPNNAQKEYYLTDVLAHAVSSGRGAQSIVCHDPREMQGVNSRLQLAEVAKAMNGLNVARLMDQGVTIVDPETTYVETDVQVGQDSILMPFTFLYGKTKVGEDCIIGPQSRLVNSTIGNSVTIENSIVKESIIGNDCLVGPYAYLRPGTVLADNVKVGDFVEIKKSHIGEGSKVPHLSYVGDASIGKDVNIGAGTITCNYDGENKYPTEIGDGAFIGSNTNLVAPVKVGSKAVIAAGSTLTKDVPNEGLGVARSRQVNVNHWVTRRHSK
ncbi:MAG: bifunctional UDP-N-acetylglucosamine diphosphorylase/glucosamine-1-phosphate N-acetyltransferase GlmU [Peptococcaceae bacterium]|nr:bifunctional UDP-N-acetylglucosamine diphosphorylase/glucosamine-1-phosphate N-acetyltransferase GlmU [Peptococcaceae bacterium]